MPRSGSCQRPIANMDVTVYFFRIFMCEATLIARLDRLSQKYSSPCQLRLTSVAGPCRRRESEKPRKRTQEVAGRCLEGRFILVFDEQPVRVQKRRGKSVSKQLVPASIRGAERGVCGHCGAVFGAENTRRTVKKDKKVPRKTFGVDRAEVVNEREGAKRKAQREVARRRQMEIDNSSSDELVMQGIPKRSERRNSFKRITYVISSGSSDDEFQLVRPERKERRDVHARRVLKIPAAKCVLESSSDGEALPERGMKRGRQLHVESDSSSDHLAGENPINSPCALRVESEQWSASTKRGSKYVAHEQRETDEAVTCDKSCWCGSVQRKQLAIGGALAMDCLSKSDRSVEESPCKSKVSIRRREESRGTSSSSKVHRRVESPDALRTSSKYSTESSRKSYGPHIVSDLEDSSSSDAREFEVQSPSKVERIAVDLARRVDPSTKSDAISSSVSPERRKRTPVRTPSSSSMSKSKTPTNSKGELSLSHSVSGMDSSQSPEKAKAKLSSTDGSIQSPIKRTGLNSSTSSERTNSSHQGSSRKKASSKSSNGNKGMYVSDRKSKTLGSTSQSSASEIVQQGSAKKQALPMSCSRELRSVLESLQEEQAQCMTAPRPAVKISDSDDELVVEVDVKRSVTEKPASIVVTNTKNEYHTYSSSSQKSTAKGSTKLSTSEKSDSHSSRRQNISASSHTSSSQTKRSEVLDDHSRSASLATSTQRSALGQSNPVTLELEEEEDLASSDEEETAPSPQRSTKERSLSSQGSRKKSSLSSGGSHHVTPQASALSGLEEEDIGSPVPPPSQYVEEESDSEHTERRISLEDLDPRQVQQSPHSESGSDDPDLKSVLKNLGISSGSLSGDMDSETVDRTLDGAKELHDSD